MKKPKTLLTLPKGLTPSRTIIQKAGDFLSNFKLRYLLSKFSPDFDVSSNAACSRFLKFKKVRDSITHPRQNEDEVDVKEYQRITRQGFSSFIEILNYPSKGIFKKPLRKKLIDLAL